MRGLSRYFEYLFGPTETEISLICNTAHYISDITIGACYLSSEVRERRIAQFCHKWESKNSPQISVEQVVDSVAYVAARATHALGACAVSTLLQNMNVVVTAASRCAALFVERFAQHVSSPAFQANLRSVTAEGVVALKASQELALEARQLILAFGVMKEKGSSRGPAALDGVAKGVEKGAEVESAQNTSINSDKYHNFSKKNIEDAVNHVMNDSCRINHIFGKKMHNLDQLVNKLGCKESVVREIIKALNKQVPQNGIVRNLLVNVGGYDIYVRGRVMDGVLKIGTMFIK